VFLCATRGLRLPVDISLLGINPNALSRINLDATVARGLVPRLFRKFSVNSVSSVVNFLTIKKRTHQLKNQVVVPSVLLPERFHLTYKGKIPLRPFP